MLKRDLPVHYLQNFNSPRTSVCSEYKISLVPVNTTLILGSHLFCNQLRNRSIYCVCLSTTIILLPGQSESRLFFFSLILLSSFKDDNLNSLYSALFNLHYTMWVVFFQMIGFSRMRLVFRSMVVLNATFVLSLPPWKRDFHQIMCRLWVKKAR